MTKNKLKVELKSVPVNDPLLYKIEFDVVAKMPNVFDTGSPDNFIDFLKEGGKSRAFIYYANGKPVGYLALCVLNNSDAMEIRSIAVMPENQGKKYGTAMMAAAETLAKKTNRKRVTLVTNPENYTAVNFYKKLGYAITDTIENYYGDGTPRYVFEKRLS